MGITTDGEMVKSGQRQLGAFLGHHSKCRVPAQPANDLDVQEVWSVQHRFAADAGRDLRAGWSLREQFKRGGGVHHDHLPSRIFRTVVAEQPTMEEALAEIAKLAPVKLAEPSATTVRKMREGR